MYQIPKETLQKLVNYLSSRPWGETNPLIGELLQLIQAQDQAKLAQVSQAADNSPIAGS